jgi:hypothetical protein
VQSSDAVAIKSDFLLNSILLMKRSFDFIKEYGWLAFNIRKSYTPSCPFSEPRQNKFVSVFDQSDADGCPLNP